MKPSHKFACPGCGLLVRLYQTEKVIMHEDPPCATFLAKLGAAEKEARLHLIDTDTDETVAVPHFPKPGAPS